MKLLFKFGAELKGDIMKKIIATIVTLIIILLTYNIEAQDRWNFELRNGASFSTNNFGDANLKTGFGFEGTIAYRFMPHLSVYAGWGWNKFSADNSFAGTEIDFEETGYTFGFQFVHPIGTTNLSYVIKAGSLYNHIEVENNDGKIISDSGHGLGWQVDAGLLIPIIKQLYLLPSVRYRSLSREITIDNQITSVELNYVSFGVGLSFSF